jgi:hypothetical protein
MNRSRALRRDDHPLRSREVISRHCGGCLTISTVVRRGRSDPAALPPAVAFPSQRCGTGPGRCRPGAGLGRRALGRRPWKTDLSRLAVESWRTSPASASADTVVVLSPLTELAAAIGSSSTSWVHGSNGASRSSRAGIFAGPPRTRCPQGALSACATFVPQLRCHRMPGEPAGADRVPERGRLLSTSVGSYPPQLWSFGFAAAIQGPRRALAAGGALKARSLRGSRRGQLVAQAPVTAQFPPNS